ncbi:MAG: ATP synthase epsilon chain [Candidatus Jorgensenbacteria bacterium GW2011_GWA2_45_13]|uniref:ATP synthase epsilon chain n=1 Tax=Candidatus Jorgensenbacteria bacterium GW2011_GWA2_45_13 TaxID=1618662 RepID=A0A0G1P7D5_9BACT|nr:MAG: ATP synthase epsilon chain [Candidatus Jorgensenbacteria bacterium GW2011_GWA2_45_13]
MLVNVYTLKKPTFKAEAQSVNLKTAVGELTILRGHRPYLTFLREGPVKILNKNGKVSILEASNGILEVLPGNRVNILLS